MISLPLKCWTRDEYYRLAEHGFIAPEERVELIEGQIVEKMSPQGTRHASALRLVAQALSDIEGHFLSQQQPVSLDEFNEPEPDVALVRGKIRDYSSRHPGPSDLSLVIELADSSLSLDQGTKARLYARFGIPIIGCWM